MGKFHRVFVIVLDSLGVGAMPDSGKFGDVGVDTFGHIVDTVGPLQMPNLTRLGHHHHRQYLSLLQLEKSILPVLYLELAGGPHRIHLLYEFDEHRSITAVILHHNGYLLLSVKLVSIEEFLGAKH